MRRKWTGCYDSGWGDLLVPDAFCHPAKVACGLVERIYDDALRRGIGPGAVVIATKEIIEQIEKEICQGLFQRIQ